MKTGTSPIEASPTFPILPPLGGGSGGLAAPSTPHLDRLISHPLSPAAAVSLSELPAEAAGVGGGDRHLCPACHFFVCLFPPSLIYLFIFPLPFTSFFLLSPSKVQPPSPPHLPCSSSAERVTGCVYI